MTELVTSGSVGGLTGNRRAYPDAELSVRLSFIINIIA